MPFPFRLLFAVASGAALAALAWPAAAAGTATVRWIEPESFSDAGRGIDRERQLQALARHVEKIGQRLPDGHRLALEVTDVQLAGEIEPFNRWNDPNLRVMRGRVDWPVIELRYTLSDATRTLASGEARLSDPSYLMRTLTLRHRGALGYEKRLIDEWADGLVRSVAAR